MLCRLELAEVHSKKQSLLEEHVSAARQQKHVSYTYSFSVCV